MSKGERFENSNYSLKITKNCMKVGRLTIEIREMTQVKVIKENKRKRKNTQR
jgi:hypothetical protein